MKPAQFLSGVRSPAPEWSPSARREVVRAALCRLLPPGGDPPHPSCAERARALQRLLNDDTAFLSHEAFAAASRGLEIP